MKAIKQLILLAAILSVLIEPGVGQHLTENVASDPVKAVFVFTDVETFVNAQQALNGNTDTITVLETEYFNKGTLGLKMFMEKYSLTPAKLHSAMRKHPEKYSALDKILVTLKSEESNFRSSYVKMKKEFNEAVFPPTYFVVGAYRGIGSGSTEGTLITIEKETENGITGDLAATLVHEMTHVQQLALLGDDYFVIFSGEERTLLALSIREGVATYIAERIEGGSTHKNAARDYLLKHEKELWTKFSSEMLGNETGEWLWSKPENPDQPQDVGYAIGARIAETFYEQSDDKQKAIKEMLSVTVYEEFLTLSGYGQQWK